MLHHVPHRPPFHDFPPDEWNIIEKGLHPEFLAQLETMLALGNGYLGMRGCPEEGGPNAENGVVTVTGWMQKVGEVEPCFMRQQPHLATGTASARKIRSVARETRWR